MLYDVNGNSVSDASFDMLYTNSPELLLLTSEASGTMQGGCTNGEYVFYCVYNQNKLFKYKPTTGDKSSITYTSGLYGHANDMTYNPVNDKIYVATMESGVIRIVNPSTLADEGSFTPVDDTNTVVSSSGIAYDREHFRYILSSGDNYYFFSAGWVYLSTFSYEAGADWTYQGLETDGTYIFRPVWNSNTDVNKVIVLDMYGNWIADIVIPTDKELETLCNDWQGVWYAPINIPGGGCNINLLSLPKYENYHAVSTIHTILDL